MSVRSARPRRRRAALTATAVVSALLVPPAVTTVAAQTDPCDVRWTGAQSSAWEDPDNWDADVPGPDDAACVDVATSLPIAVTDGHQVVDRLLVDEAISGHVVAITRSGTGVSSLELRGPSDLGEAGLILGDEGAFGTPRLIVGDDLAVRGDSRWPRGELTGDGATTFLGSLTGPTVSRTRVLDDHDLTLAGSTTYGAGGLFLRGGSLLTNTGTLTLNATANIMQEAGNPTFRNEGTLVQASSATNWIVPRFDNPGDVEVDQGTLRLDGPGESTGTMHVAEPATLQFAYAVISQAAAYRNAADGAISGPGTVAITQFAGLRNEGTYDVGRTEITRPGLQSSSGTWAVDGDTGSLLLAGSNLRGQDSGLQVTGDIEYRRGTITRDGSVFQSAGFVGEAGGDLLLTTSGQKRLETNSLLRVLGAAVQDGGEFRVDASEVAVTGSYTLAGDLLNLIDGTVRATALGVGPDATLQGAGTVDADGDAAGTVIVGVQGSSAPFGFGSRLGTLTVTGDLDQSGTLVVRVAGAAPGEHDQLAVDGEAAIDGRLEVILAEELALEPGDRVPIVTAGPDREPPVDVAQAGEQTVPILATTVSGTFAEVELPDLPGDLTWTVEYAPSAVFLVVADEGPEPTDPEPTDPEPTDPEPTDPEPTDPGPTDPEPTDPEPTGPEQPEVEETVVAGPASPTDGSDPVRVVDPPVEAGTAGAAQLASTGATPLALLAVGSLMLATGRRLVRSR